jgi:hypothetical protein
VIDKHALAAEAEVRVTIRAALTPATPRRHLLLRDPDHNDAEAALIESGVQVRANAVLLRLPPLETDHRNLTLGGEALDRGHVATADITEQRRRRDRETAVEQKPHHQTLAHQPRHIPLQEDPVDRTHPKSDVVAQ